MAGAVPLFGHSGHRPNGVVPPGPTQWTVWAGGRSLSTVDSGHCPLFELWFVTYADGAKLKTIGLLVGAGDGAKGSLAGVPIHESFFVVPGIFAPPKRVRRKSAELSVQDRLGKSRTQPALLAQ